AKRRLAGGTAHPPTGTFRHEGSYAVAPKPSSASGERDGSFRPRETTRPGHDRRPAKPRRRPRSATAGPSRVWQRHPLTVSLPVSPVAQQVEPASSVRVPASALTT